MSAPTGASAGGRRFYPISLDLGGRRCVVIGGGPVAEQKVLGLLDAGAQVTVVSPDLSLGLQDRAAQGLIATHRREYRSGDLAGAFLAVAATDDRTVNRRVWREAEERGTLLNAVDDLPHCHFIAPAVHRQGDITVAVSTAGKSPALAVRLRESIARLIDPAQARLLDLLGELRPVVARRVPDTVARTRLWYEIVDSDAIEYLRRGDVGGARRRIAQLIEDSTATPDPAREPPGGVVYLVGAGPGDPGLLTVRGLQLLRTADAVVHDRLVHPSLVDQAPHTAQRFCVGKRPEGHVVEQSRIDALLIALAGRGLRVVRLKGGDPFVFGRGAEECEALHAAGIRFEVVPGVTSAVAVPASAGIPVTHRRLASGFAVVTGHECEGESDVDWSAVARLPTVVVLMGLRVLSHVAARLVAHGAPPDTPAAVIANGTLPDARTVVATLDTIASAAEQAGLEPPATLIVGEVVRMRAQLGIEGAEDLVLEEGRT